MFLPKVLKITWLWLRCFLSASEIGPSQHHLRGSSIQTQTRTFCRILRHTSCRGSFNTLWIYGGSDCNEPQILRPGAARDQRISFDQIEHAANFNWLNSINRFTQLGQSRATQKQFNTRSTSHESQCPSGMRSNVASRGLSARLFTAWRRPFCWSRVVLHCPLPRKAMAALFRWRSNGVAGYVRGHRSTPTGHCSDIIILLRRLKRLQSVLILSVLHSTPGRKFNLQLHWVTRLWPVFTRTPANYVHRSICAHIARLCSGSFPMTSPYHVHVYSHTRGVTPDAPTSAPDVWTFKFGSLRCRTSCNFRRGYSRHESHVLSLDKFDVTITNYCLRVVRAFYSSFFVRRKSSFFTFLKVVSTERTVF